MTRMLAVELARRNRAIRVNCILPGPVMLPEDLSARRRCKGAVAGTLAEAARPARARRPGGRVPGRERLRDRRLPAGGRRPDDRRERLTMRPVPSPSEECSVRANYRMIAHQPLGMFVNLLSRGPVRVN